MARDKKYQSAAEKQKAYRRRKRNANQVNRNALIVTKFLDLLNALPEETRFKVWFLVRDELYRGSKIK